MVRDVRLRAGPDDASGHPDKCGAAMATAPPRTHRRAAARRTDDDPARRQGRGHQRRWPRTRTSRPFPFSLHPFGGIAVIEQYVVGLHEVDETQVAVVGGKGAHLGALSRIDGIRVPAGFCVTTDAFRRIVAEAPSIDDRLDQLSRLDPDDREAIRALSAEIRRTVEEIAVPWRSRGGDHRRSRPARRAGRLRRPIQRDGRGPADGLLRRPAGHVPERRRPGRDPRARQPVLGLAVHRAGRDLPPAQRHRPPHGPHGRGRAADGLPAGGRRPVHGRPRHVQPEGRLRGGRLRPR